MIVIDTSVWSLAFRRKETSKQFSNEVQLLKDMIRGNDLLGVPGVVLQELLTGLKGDNQKERMLRTMSWFELLLATEQDHLRAAEIANQCRQNGIAAKTVDSLIAAIAIERNAYLFTTVADFVHIAHYCPLQLF